MAQTGFTPILTYASGTTGNTPAAGNLTNSALGAEMAINYADGFLFYKDSTGVVRKIATKDAAAGVFVGTGAITVPVGAQAQRPAAPTTGMFRFNTDANRFEGYNGTAWEGIADALVNAVVDVDSFTGNGVQVNFNLNKAPASKNSTQVYINGVYQDKTTYSLAGVTITFSAAPPVGSGIQVVTIDQDVIDASDIPYTPAGVGAITTNVQTKLRETVSVKDFGAVGDGVTDDAAAINAAVAALPAGQTLDGLGLTYLVKSSINLKANMTLQNFVFDFSQAGNSAELLVASGSMGATVATSGDTPDRNEATLTLTSTAGLSAGDYVFLSSTDLWDNWDDIVTFGEIHKIKSITPTDVTFYDPCLYTTTNGFVAKINTLDNLTLRNIRAFGNGAGAAGDQEGMRFSYCRNLLIDNCNFTKFDDRSVRLTRCIDFEVRGGQYGIANKTALSYGVALGDCCTNGVIHGATFIDTRHGVSLGDTAGPNRYIVISNNVFTQCREAGVDGHTAADHCVVANNIIQVDPNNSVGGYGILWRSINVNISNNRISSSGSHGIYVLDNVTGAEGDVSVTDNSVNNCQGASGIFVSKQREGNIRRINIANNNIEGNYTTSANGVEVSTSSTAANVFSGVVISGNAIAGVANNGIVVNAKGATAVIRSVSITGNTIRMVGTRGIYVLAGADPNINGISVVGNTLGGTITIGVVGLNEENIAIVGNNLLDTVTPVSITASNNVNANNLP